jgi:hypothetical protein
MLLIGAGSAAVVHSQPPAASEARSSYSPPRTSWGDPDFEGVWPSGAMISVPFERPASFGDRATLNDTEYAAREAQLGADLASQQEAFVTRDRTNGAVTGTIDWNDIGRPSRQASWVVDPPNGRLPPITEDGARRAKAMRNSFNTTSAAGPEDFGVYERCISRGVLGSAFPNIYNTGTRIMQTPGYVVIHHEMIHETRLIPLDGRPHLRRGIQLYMGDARGRWEGNSLVIETTNFNGKTGSYGRNGNGNPTSDALTLRERFTRIDADTLQYEVTVDDPQTWTRPWTVAFPLKRDPGYGIYEYACHEGNYALANMLRAARVEEQSGGAADAPR